MGICIYVDPRGNPSGNLSGNQMKTLDQTASCVCISATPQGYFYHGAGGGGGGGGHWPLEC